VVERRRDERRHTGRRRLRELAAIATALLVVPVAAVLGLKLPLDAAGVLAPIFDLPRTAFGHVRSSTDGAVQLSDSSSGGERVAFGDDAPFLPPTPPRRYHHPHAFAAPKPTPHHRTDDSGARIVATTPDASDVAPDGPSSEPTGGGNDRETPQAPPLEHPAPLPADPPKGITPPPDTAGTPGDSDVSHAALEPAAGPTDESSMGDAPEAGEPTSDPPSSSASEPVDTPTISGDDETGEPWSDPGTSGGGDQVTLSTGETEDPGASGDGQPAPDEPDQPADTVDDASDGTVAPDDPPAADDSAGDPEQSDGDSQVDDQTGGPGTGVDQGDSQDGNDQGGDQVGDGQGDDQSGNGRGNGNGNGNSNGQGNSNGNDNGNGNQNECYGTGLGNGNGNGNGNATGNGNCQGQGVANGHNPNHHGGNDQGAVLASPLLLLALAGCGRRIRLVRRRRAA
jgi:hypothetical protein